jgi:hypothetical protein
MTSYAERLAIELRNAYEAHDRDAHDRALRRMVETMTYTGPIPKREQVHGAPPDSVNNATFAGSLNCTLSACECKTWPQAKTCMHRRTA